MTNKMPYRHSIAARKQVPVLVTGGSGMLGRALIAELEAEGYLNILAPGRDELDLLDTRAVSGYMRQHRPCWIFHLASVVYGLLGNMRNQVVALTDNTLINHNVLSAAGAVGVQKIFCAGSVAAYPYPYPALPLREEMLWHGTPHRGEYGYASAKRHALAYLDVLHEAVGIDYCYGILTNLYGPHDRFDDRNGHVIPSLIHRLQASLRSGDDFRVWGDGSARRDFMHARDAARAILVGMHDVSGLMNISSGTTASVREVVDVLVGAAGYCGRIVWQPDMPVGIPERSVCNRILRGHGFTCAYDIETGLAATWDWYEAHAHSLRGLTPERRLSA
jgi:GDP-L-fucose synthase